MLEDRTELEVELAVLDAAELEELVSAKELTESELELDRKVVFSELEELTII